MKSLESYFKPFDETKNLQALEIMPYIIEMLARDYQDDPDSVWIASGILFDIVFELGSRNKIELLTKDTSAEFKSRCFQYCKERIQDGTFARVFGSDDYQSMKNLIVLVAFVPPSNMAERVEIIAFYFSTLRIDTANMIAALHLLQKSLNIDYRHIAEYAAPICVKKILNSNLEKSEKQSYISNFAGFIDFLILDQTISKTQLLILRAALSRAKK